MHRVRNVDPCPLPGVPAMDLCGVLAAGRQATVPKMRGKKVVMAEARLDTDAMIALRDAARIPIQQAIEVISEGVTKDHFAVPSVLEGKFRRALTHLLEARDELK